MDPDIQTHQQPAVPNTQTTKADRILEWFHVWKWTWSWEYIDIQIYILYYTCMYMYIQRIVYTHNMRNYWIWDMGWSKRTVRLCNKQAVVYIDSLAHALGALFFFPSFCVCHKCWPNQIQWKWCVAIANDKSVVFIDTCVVSCKFKAFRTRRWPVCNVHPFDKVHLQFTRTYLLLNLLYLFIYTYTHKLHYVQCRSMIP